MVERSPRRQEGEARREDWDREVSSGKFKLSSGYLLPKLAWQIFRFTGLLPRARAEARNLQVLENKLLIKRLPPSFEGTRVLQISDLHVNNQPDLCVRLRELIAGVKCDLVVLTGDFIDDGHDMAHSVELLEPLLSSLPAPALAVLGNHDRMALVEPLQNWGIQVLLNAFWIWERGGEVLAVVGVDDAGYFRAADLPAARAGLDPAIPWLLLSHDPCLYRAGAEAGAGGFLAGHTHGGQICLPGGFLLLKRSPVPRRIASGPWEWGGMSGYTSRGAGCGSVPLRWNCPPEVTVHTLSGD